MVAPMKHALSIALALVALAGCKKKDDAGTASGTGTATASAAPADAAAAAAPDAAAAATTPDAAEPAAAPDATTAAAIGPTIKLEGLAEGGGDVEIDAPDGAKGNVWETEDTGIQARVTLADDTDLEVNKPPEMDTFEKEKANLESTYRVDWMEPDDGGWVAIYGARKGRDKALNVIAYRKGPNLACFAGDLKTREQADAIVPICKSLRLAK
jgi:hypothetical protein